MILLEMQNDANQHILLTISITNAGSSCDAFCPLYLSQLWSVYAYIDAGKSIWEYPTQPAGRASHCTLHFCPQQSHNFPFQTKDGASPTVTVGEQLCSSIAPVPGCS